MAYTKTTWKEHSMDTTAKLAALNNLEGLVAGATAYIDTITHSTRYYTDAQAEAVYFYSGNDGTGSLLTCETLDGYTATQIMSTGIPSGIIGIWSGSVGSIPSGWFICDGNNSTPDLRDKFVVGCGSHYAVGATGGSNTVTTMASVTIAGHALTTLETPKHTHGNITDTYSVYSTITWAHNPGGVHLDGTVTDTPTNTGSTGGGDAHTHTATWTGTASQSKLPPYYALCYMMRS